VSEGESFSYAREENADMRRVKDERGEPVPLTREDTIELTRFRWFLEEAAERLKRGASKDEAEGAAYVHVYHEDAPQ
jgi:hypothetical protein